MTRRGEPLGTPADMAPKQTTGDAPAGPACDIYALGVTLYELLTGRLPFPEPSLGEFLGQLLTQEPESPSVHRHDLDPALEKICLTALAKRPERRFPSMGEMATALARHLMKSQ